MNLKFGDKVEIKKAGFFKGAKGVVINHSQSEGSFTVVLENNIYKDFFVIDLKKLSKRKRR